MHRTLLALALALAAALVAGCAEETVPESGPLTSAAKPKTTSAPTTEAPEESRPGDPAVYARIAKMTDCDALQEQFDLAERTHQRGGEWGPIGTAYMQAADDRMREVGCY
jgi:hypothetical protein